MLWPQFHQAITMPGPERDGDGCLGQSHGGQGRKGLHVVGEVTQQRHPVAEPPTGTPEQKVIGEIDRLEHQLVQRLSTLKKLKDVLSRTRKSIQTRNKPISTLITFVSQVRRDSAQLTAI